MASPLRHALRARRDHDDDEGDSVAVCFPVVPERTPADDGGKRGSSSFQTHVESLGKRFVVAGIRKEADDGGAVRTTTWLAET